MAMIDIHDNDSRIKQNWSNNTYGFELQDRWFLALGRETQQSFWIFSQMDPSTKGTVIFIWFTFVLHHSPPQLDQDQG